MNYGKSVDAIVLAGGTQLSSWRKAGYIITSIFTSLDDLISYGHTHISESKYKSIMGFAGEIDGDKKIRPLVEYTLNNLQNTKKIDKIFVVGPKKELEKSLYDTLWKYEKLTDIIEQTDTFGGNVKKGYDAAGGTGHKLIHVCDTPGSREKEINEFLDISKDYVDDYKLIYPIVARHVIEQVKQSLLTKKRLYFKLVPDNINEIKTSTNPVYDEKGRMSIRISSMALADLEGINASTIEETFQSRKMVRKSVRRRLKKILGANIAKRYRQGLNLSEIEKIIEDFVCDVQDNINKVPIKIVQLSLPGSTFDCDTKKDIKELEKMNLNY